MKFEFSDDNKRYHTLNFYNKHKYGAKVYKAAINAGLTCPNIDGKLGVGGCIYCESGSSYFTKGDLFVREQILKEFERINKNRKNNKFIIYYQSNTNTYTSIEKLKEMLDIALEFDIVGVTLSTRTDCLDDEKTELLKEYNKKTEICVEFGLQSIHNETLKFINRCQTFESFLNEYNRFKTSGIRNCIHIINGLPYETEEMMIETAKKVGVLSPNGIKIHALHIAKGTKLNNIYYQKPFSLLSKEEYIRIVSKQLEYLPKTTVIERITGDGDKKKLVAPMWTADKISVLGGIDKYQAENNTYQGKALERA